MSMQFPKEKRRHHEFSLFFVDLSLKFDDFSIFVSFVENSRWWIFSLGDLMGLLGNSIENAK